MSTTRKLFQQTAVYGVATVLPRVLTVLLNLLLTTFIDTKQDFGNLSIIFSWIIIFNVILTYGMETSFFRFYSHSKSKKKVLSTSLLGLLATTTLFTVIAFLNLDNIELWSGKNSEYWRWVIGVLALDTLMVIPFAYLRAQGMARKYAIIKMIDVVISFVLTTFFLVFLSDFPVIQQWFPTDKVELFFIALFTPKIFLLLLLIKPYFHIEGFDVTIWKQMMKYGTPILVAGLAFAINETFDKQLIEWLSPGNSTAQAGLYTACYRLAVGMTLFATAFKLGVEPFFFSESKDKNAPQLYASITKMFVILGAIALVFYITLIDVVKLAVIDSDYYEAIFIVPYVLVAYFFFGIYQSLSVWYKVTDKTKYGAIISVFGAIITIAANVLLIPKIGYLASAITTCVAYGVMMIVSYLWSRKHFPIPYDIKSILLYLLLSIGATVVIFYLIRDSYGAGSWQQYVYGLSISLLVSAFILVREKNFILQLLKKNDS